MIIEIATLFPEMFKGPFTESIIKRAVESQYVEFKFHNPRDFSTDKHKKVDDYPFGGEAGMVMTPQPLADMINHLTSKEAFDAIIFMTPDGARLDQRMVNSFSHFNRILILNGHYKGIDQRIRDKYVTHEVSIGDYVISGGELATAVFCDALVRIIPGVLGDSSSALTDSFQDGLLAPPVYTRPASFRGMSVPEVLRSGNFGKIDQWKLEKALEKTKIRRPDLLNPSKK
jgi:tRNA (guanine37-N1)-methyltransferase